MPSRRAQLEPLPQQICQCAWQCCNVSQDDVERKREGVNILCEHRLAVHKIHCLHLQQGAGGVVQDDECVQHAFLGRSFLQTEYLGDKKP